MKILASLLSRNKRPRLDPCYGDPHALELRERLEGHEFPAAERTLAQAPDIETLDLWIRACGDWPGRPAWLDAWVQAWPQSPFAHLVRGAHSVLWAWEARTSRHAAEVDKSAWPAFYQRLELAQDDLDMAQKLAPDSPLPSALLIPALMGMQCEPEQIEATFDNAIAHAATLRSAHMAMLTASCAKWGGSHEAMFSFARRAAVRSPALQLLIPAAHIERLASIEADEARVAYAARDDFHEEVIAAFDVFLRGCDRVATIVGGNYFAFAFCLARDRSRAARAFALADPYVTRSPWLWIGDPVETYARYRDLIRRRA